MAEETWSLNIGLGGKPVADSQQLKGNVSRSVNWSPLDPIWMGTSGHRHGYMYAQYTNLGIQLCMFACLLRTAPFPQDDSAHLCHFFKASYVHSVKVGRLFPARTHNL